MLRIGSRVLPAQLIVVVVVVLHSRVHEFGAHGFGRPLHETLATPRRHLQWLQRRMILFILKKDEKDFQAVQTGFLILLH